MLTDFCAVCGLSRRDAVEMKMVKCLRWKWLTRLVLEWKKARLRSRIEERVRSVPPSPPDNGKVEHADYPPWTGMASPILLPEECRDETRSTE